MDTTNTNTNTNEAVVDVVAQDFKASLFIVSLLTNLVVFVSWLTIALS